MKKKTDNRDIEIGEKIRAIRLLAGMSQDALAKKLGITFQQIQKYESGKNRACVTRLMDISDALQTSINYFTSNKKQKDETLLSKEEIVLILSYRKINGGNLKTKVFDFVKAMGDCDGKK